MNGLLLFFMVIGIYTAIVMMLHRFGIVRKHLFNLGTDLLQYIGEGPAGEMIANEFQKNGHPLSGNAKVSRMDENAWVLQDGRKRYRVAKLEDKLSVYLDLYNISFYGPFLMWRTEKGKEMIDRLAKRHHRFFTAYGRISIWVCILAMVSMMFLLILQAGLALRIEARNAPSPILMVGIPGVNPLIPVWYGIFALAVAIVVHEFAHGIQARLFDLEIKSLGILWLVVPMGAFVEPDEEKIMELPSKKRQRMFAVGPATNIFVALLCVLSFSWGFMSSIEPKEEGMLIISVTSNEEDGVVAPADELDFKPGMIIVSIDGVNYTDSENFGDFLESKRPGENITIVMYDTSKPEGQRFVTYENVTLVQRSVFTGDDDDDDKGYLGVGTYSTVEFAEEMSHPYANDDYNPVKMMGSTLFYIAMPFFKLTPFPDEITDNYEVTGPLSGLPEPVFWVLANLLFWLFWLNLMVGITNALPAVPLDGGYIFRDKLHDFVTRTKKGISEDRADELVSRYTRYLAYGVLFLILWQLIAPRLTG